MDILQKQGSWIVEKGWQDMVESVSKVLMVQVSRA